MHLDTFIAREYAAEHSLTEADARELARQSGVHFGGMEYVGRKGRSDAEIVAAAEAKSARAEAFAKTPRGRFIEAVHHLADLPTYEDHNDRLLAAYSRGLADDRRPVSASEAGYALDILNQMPPCTARTQAIGALADLLMAKAA